MIHSMKIVSKLLLGVLLLGWVVPLRADEKSKALLSSLSAQMDAYTSYEIDFTSSMQGEFSRLDGKVIVSGERYYMNTPGMEIFFDGESIWTYTHDLKQVVREKPRTGTNLLDNPVRFFKLYDADFEHVYRGRATWQGKSVDVVELTPRRSGEGYSSMVLRLDASTHLPVSLSYQMESSSAPLEITVRKLTPNVPVTDARFTFDQRAHKEVEVVDFR